MMLAPADFIVSRNDQFVSLIVHLLPHHDPPVTGGCCMNSRAISRRYCTFPNAGYTASAWRIPRAVFFRRLQDGEHRYLQEDTFRLRIKPSARGP